MEYSYLRAADKKHDVPEHIEKTVLFLVDASAIAQVHSEAQDWEAKASAAKEAEQEAAAAVKAAWHAAKEAKEASQLSKECCYECVVPAVMHAATKQVVVVLLSISSKLLALGCQKTAHMHSAVVVCFALMDPTWVPHGRERISYGFVS